MCAARHLVCGMARRRWRAYLGALATYGFMATVALAHHPLGLLLGLP